MKAFICVDVQNDFISGPLGSKEAQAITPNVIQAIKNYADEGAALFFTKDTHDESYLNTQEGRNLPVPHCIKNTNGWELHEEIESTMIRNGFNAYCRYVIQKETFGSRDLLDLVASTYKRKVLDEIIICGVATDICVMANFVLLKTYFPEVPIRVLENCCAGTTPEKHAAAIEVMKSLQAIID